MVEPDLAEENWDRVLNLDVSRFYSFDRRSNAVTSKSKTFMAIFLRRYLRLVAPGLLMQIRSALSTLTNTKAILALGPNRSILGTIIRPNRILLERKGGQNGDVTFNSLLPGAGESLPMPSNEKSNGGLLCNWHLDEDEEGSFPRGSGRKNGDVITTPIVDTPGNKSKESSRKKTKKKKSKNKVVDDDDEEEK
ncbi:unnamed protein product [Cochlearia groenlandica]